MVNETALIACCHCGKALSNAPEHAGNLVACPSCWNVFTMPDTAHEPGLSGVGSVNSIASEESNQTPDILPMGQKVDLDIKRPSGVTVLGIVGFTFSGFGLLASLLVLLYEIEPIFHSSEAGGIKFMPDGRAIVMVTVNIVLLKFIVFCLFMLCFIHVSYGLLKRRNHARRSFNILAGLIILSVLIQITMALKYKNAQLGLKTDILELASLGYLAVGFIYLGTKRVKQWFKLSGSLNQRR